MTSFRSSALAIFAFATILARVAPARAQCLGGPATAARLEELATSNRASIAAAIASIDRGRGLSDLTIAPRVVETPPRPLTHDEMLQVLAGRHRPTRARVERRPTPGASPRIVLVASSYTFDPCTEPDLAPDAYVFVRLRSGRVIPIHVIYDDRAEPVASCECVGGCGIALPRRWIAREYHLPVRSLRDVAPIETVHAPRVVPNRPPCVGRP